MMRALHLDFARPMRGTRLAVVPVLIAVALAATAFAWRIHLEAAIGTLDSQLSKLEREAGAGAAAPGVGRAVEEEVNQVNEVIEQIALPWDRLFRAIEGATLDGVGLLGIAPDARNGNVQIRAQTADPEAMFAYARRLSEQPDLANVLLLEHRIESGKTARPFQFVISASWMEQAGR